MFQDKTEIIDRANRSNVMISALDARGVYVLIPGGDASQPSGFNLDAERMKSDFRRQEAFSAERRPGGIGGGHRRNLHS
jgi:hypothetical protein